MNLHVNAIATGELLNNSVISILETTADFDLKLARYLKGEGKQ